MDYIENLPIFEKWSKELIKHLNVQLCQQKYQAGDVIYDIGSNPNVLYILMSGKVAMETEVEIEETNKCPTGYNCWEVQITKRRIFYEIRQLKANDVFGHQELIKLLEQEDSHNDNIIYETRNCRMRAVTACELIYLNKEYFSKCK